jgi:hypothetical protein
MCVGLLDIQDKIMDRQNKIMDPRGTMSQKFLFDENTAGEWV